MSNAEGNPNDKIRNDSQRLAQDSVIRASSLIRHSCFVISVTLGSCRWLRSNVQKHSRFPIAVLFLYRETMKRDRFHIRALVMTSRI